MLATYGDVDRDRTVAAARVVEGQHLVMDRPFARSEIGDGHHCGKRNQNGNSTFHVDSRRTDFGRLGSNAAGLCSPDISHGDVTGGETS